MKNPLRFLLPALILSLLSGGLLQAAEPETWPWNRAQAKVLPTGELEWAPEPFEFVAGETVRYIDYEGGDDANPGSREAPWKHHPWDGNATGNAAKASGPVTYVFKGGVIYRGTLEGRESGRPDAPIRLTRDPSWGEGPAWFVGSRAINGGWKQADASIAPEGMPEPEKVWYRDLPDLKEAPWCVWRREGSEATRIPLARHPNWDVFAETDFVMEDWLTFDGPSRYVPKNEGGAPIGSRKTWDDDFLKDPSRSPDFFDGARIWTMWSGGPFSAMGTPYDTRIQKYDPESGTIERPGIGGAFYFGMAGKGDRYYIENLAAFLDSAGEFYFAASEGDGQGGRLFLRLPGDQDPNQTTVEIGQEQMLIRLYDTRNLEISGLRFSFLNVPDSFNFPIYPLDVRLPTAIMLYGDCKDLRIAHNDFYHAAKAVQARTRFYQRWMPEMPESLGIRPREDGGTDYMTGIVVSDNDIRYADHGGISFQGHGQLIAPEAVDHRLGDIRILRNRLHQINFRPRPPSPGLNIPSIAVDDGTRIHIAGNILTRSWGVGIWITGGKQNSGDIRDRPLIRNYIHHNSVLDSLLFINDWGAFALWQGGPQYAWSNVAGNPVGPHPHIMDGKDSGDRKQENYFRSYGHNGYAYYLDGSYKQYVFNNIAWGKENDPESWFKNRSSQMMVLGFLNQWFNNSFHRFLIGASGSSGTHSTALGTIYADMGSAFIAQGISGDISTAYGGEDAADTLRIGMPTLGYAQNIFQGPAFDTDTAFALGTKGRGSIRINTNSVEEFSAWLKEHGAQASQAGWRVDASPFLDADTGDFRPNPSVLEGKPGVKFFVPFSLHMVVGEWDFSANHNNPELIMGQNFYMSPEYISRKMYYDIPRNDLDLPGGTLADFAQGTLENWTDSSLLLDGRERFAVLRHDAATADYPRTVAISRNDKGWLGTPSDPGPAPGEKAGQGKKDRWAAANEKWQQAEDKIFPGHKRKTVDMQANNFLLETVVRIAPGTGGAIVSKTQDGTGYELSIAADGKLTLALLADGTVSKATGATTVADGGWHHLIAEVDRANGTARLYLDGKLDAETPLSLPTAASLANTGDFFVGKGEAGFLTGAIDFLRVSRGTLADAHTTIDELYAWQFTQGPFLKDMQGRKRDWTTTPPGAIGW